MANITTITSPGANLGGADKVELFLEKFGGEVLTAYAENLVLVPRMRTRTLTNAKSATFGALGKLVAQQHLRGVDKHSGLAEQDVGEKLIHLDRPTYANTFLDEWEEMVNHYDLRQPIAFELGQAIAEDIETRFMRLLVRGASEASSFTDHPSGNVITSANADTSGADLAEAFKEQAQFYDENSVPAQGRFGIVKPAQYYLLAEQTDFHDMQIGNGSNGSLKEGRIGRMYGIDVLMSNFVPATDTSGTTADYETNGYVNDYFVDATNTVAVFGTGRALGMVQLQGLRMLMDENRARYGGTFFEASRTVGGNLLRPVDCGQVKTA